MTLPELTTRIDETVRPAGGPPLLSAADLNGVLHTLATELYPTPAPAPEADLSSRSPTAVPSVQAVATALATSNRHIADAITRDFVRTGYPDAQRALDGAGDHGTANVYSLAYGAINPDDPTTTVPGLIFPNNTLITNLYGLALYTPDANTDVLTFSGGTQIVNANHTTVVGNPVRHNTGLGWTVTAHNGQVQDVTIHDLHLVVQSVRTHALYFVDPGRYQFSGSITLGRVAFWPEENYFTRWGVHNRQGTFLGRGTIAAYGTDAATVGANARGLSHVLFAVGNGATTTWEGNVQVYDDVVNTLSTNATLVLREGVLSAQGRTPGMPPLFGAAAAGSTIILENYAVLARPDEEALHAETVILRGSSVVVGTITATHLLDERPAAFAQTNVVHLDGAETITGPKTFASPVVAPAFVGDGSQLTALPTGPRCTATGLNPTEFTGSPTEFTLPFLSATGTGYDVGSHHFTPGKAGFYGITMGALVSNTAVGGEMYIGLLINGGRYVMVQHWQSTVAGAKGGGTGYVEIELGAGDSVAALLLHDNGGQPYQVFSDYYQTFFTARWLGN